jgi:hypothetical protein
MCISKDESAAKSQFGRSQHRMPNIPLKKHQIWFRSNSFEIEVGEDKETNPLFYGRQLARWLESALQGEGVIVEKVFPEDWGWCVIPCGLGV